MTRRTILLLTTVLLATAAGANAQGEDLFNAEVLADGTLLIQHLNSYHNCCIFVTHETVIEGFTIAVQEVEPYLNGCWCNCYFDLELSIADLPPGEYAITYTWDDDAHLSTEDWQTAELTAVVPDPELEPGDPQLQTTVSDCHNGGSVWADDVRFGAVKARYR